MNTPIPSFDEYIEDNYIRIYADLYKSIENGIYCTFEQVEERYATLKFVAKQKIEAEKEN